MEVVQNSFTQVLRDQLFEFTKEFDAVLKPNGKIIYLGTPQNEMSLYNELQERGYTAIIFPARYPYDDNSRNNYGDRLADYIASRYDSDPNRYAGKPTDPLRFDEEDLQRRELSYGRAGFALQFMLDTTLSDADRYPLRLKDILVGMFDRVEAPMKLTWLPDASKRLSSDIPSMGLKGDYFYYYNTASEEIQKYAYKCLTIDPSGRGKDETGYCVLYVLNGYIYLMKVGGLLGGYSDVVLEKLATIARDYKVQEVIIEANFGDGMYTRLFEPVLKKIYPNCGITEVKSTGQKELRIIDTLEPVLGNHKFCTTPEVIQQDFNSVPEGDFKYSFFYQLTRLTHDRGALIHDDRLDSVAIGVKYIKDFMGIDDDVGIQEASAQWYEDSMNGLLKHFTTRTYGKSIVDTYDDSSDNVANIDIW